MPTKILIDAANWNRLMESVLADGPVSAAIVINDPEVQKYWRVVEFGSREGARPWPEPQKRTRRGRDGRIVSTQAPQGFVRPNLPKIMQLLVETYQKKFQALKRPLTQAELKAVLNEVGAKALVLLKASAPKSSGKMANSLELERAK